MAEACDMKNVVGTSASAKNTNKMLGATAKPDAAVTKDPILEILKRPAVVSANRPALEYNRAARRGVQPGMTQRAFQNITNSLRFDLVPSWVWKWLVCLLISCCLSYLADTFTPESYKIAAGDLWRRPQYENNTKQSTYVFRDQSEYVTSEVHSMTTGFCNAYTTMQHHHDTFTKTDWSNDGHIRYEKSHYSAVVDHLATAIEYLKPFCAKGHEATQGDIATAGYVSYTNIGASIQRAGDRISLTYWPVPIRGREYQRHDVACKLWADACYRSSQATRPTRNLGRAAEASLKEYREALTAQNQFFRIPAYTRHSSSEHALSKQISLLQILPAHTYSIWSNTLRRNAQQAVSELRTARLAIAHHINRYVFLEWGFAAQSVKNECSFVNHEVQERMDVLESAIHRYRALRQQQVEEGRGGEGYDNVQEQAMNQLKEKKQVMRWKMRPKNAKENGVWLLEAVFGVVRVDGEDERGWWSDFDE